MDYKNIERTLKDSLLIGIDDIETVKNGGNLEIVEKILWKSVWQCNAYFPSVNFFGPLPPKNKKDNSVIDLVMPLDSGFEYLLRRIIIENIAMELFLHLGNMVYADEKIISGTSYLTLFYGHGYYEMASVLNDNGKFKEEFLNKAIGSTVSDEERFRSNRSNNIKKIHDFMKNPYITSIRKYIPELDNYLMELEKRKGKEDITIPLFDCAITSILVKNDVFLKKIYQFLNSGEKDNKRLFSSVMNGINKYGTAENYINESKVNVQQENSEIILDQNILRYKLESVFHLELQKNIVEVIKNLDSKYGIHTSYLTESLINSVNMGIQFGMDYILWYPLKYIHNLYINMDNNSMESAKSNHYAYKGEAESIWIRKYYEYLEILSYVTVPIVRTTFELNLYKYCKALQKNSNKDVCMETKIKKDMFNLLETYEKKHSGAVQYDYRNGEQNYLLKPSYMTIIEQCVKNPSDAYRYYNFKKKDISDLEKFKDNSLSYNTLMKAYKSWFDPENYRKYHNRAVITSEYIDITQERDMGYYNKEIEEAEMYKGTKKYNKLIIDTRMKSIIVKHNKNSNLI